MSMELRRDDAEVSFRRFRLVRFAFRRRHSAFVRPSTTLLDACDAWVFAIAHLFSDNEGKIRGQNPKVALSVPS